MSRWLALATILFSFGIVAAAPAPTPAKKPAAVGDTVVLAAKPASGPFVGLIQPRLGDPDQPDFENNCQIDTPLEIKVLGLLDDPVVESVVVAEYRTKSKDGGMFYCRDGAILLFSQEAWSSLKAAEAALAKERAAQDRRREEVRKILRRSGRLPASP